MAWRDLYKGGGGGGNSLVGTSTRRSGRGAIYRRFPRSVGKGGLVVTAGAAAGAVHGAGDVGELGVRRLDRRAGAGQTGGGGGDASRRAARLVAPRVTFQLPAIIQAFPLVTDLHPLASRSDPVFEGERPVLQGKGETLVSTLPGPRPAPPPRSPGEAHCPY